LKNAHLSSNSYIFWNASNYCNEICRICGL